MELPKTADGVMFEPGMTLYSANFPKGEIISQMHVGDLSSFEPWLVSGLDFELLTIYRVDTAGCTTFFTDGLWYCASAQIDQYYSSIEALRQSMYEMVETVYKDLLNYIDNFQEDDYQRELEAMED